jgi:hypothetical protein
LKPWKYEHLSAKSEKSVNEDRRVRIALQVASLDDLASMRKNVADRGGLTDQLVNALRQREFELYQEQTADRLGRRLEQLTSLELRIVQGLAALWMTHERHLPPNRSIQALRNRDGDLIKFAEDVVSSGLESSGYRRLMTAGFAELVFERVVLEHPGVFSEKARTNARRRLDALEQGPLDAQLGDEEQKGGDGEYSPKRLFEDARDDSEEWAVEDDIEFVQRRDDIDSTTKEALVKARRGQGQFRLDMLKLWQGRCAVTELAVASVLVASHAVAWKDSTDAERLDGHNGLLLAATIDKLFDQYLIAFDPSTRQMLLSETLTAADREKMELPLSIRQSLSTKQAGYLARHREIFFLREEKRNLLSRALGPESEV